ncbi:MAG TPA: hypothetical protein VE035_05920 [Puia sp.]|nr:hypothetical protein [Puia sp.]
MKFHKSLRLFTVINFVSCVIFFCCLYHYLISENDKGLNVALGWIGWLAMLTFIVPACISDTTRAEWFSKEYGPGTLLLLFANVIAVIMGDYLAYTLVK